VGAGFEQVLADAHDGAAAHWLSPVLRLRQPHPAVPEAH